MKRSVLFVAAMVWGLAVCGQRPVRDTLECPDSAYNQQYVQYRFIYNWCTQDEFSWHARTDYHRFPNPYDPLEYWATDPDGTLSPNVEVNYYVNGNGISGAQFGTDRPLKIVGIAAPAYREAARDTSFSGTAMSPRKFLNTRDTTLAGRVTDSMILYQVVGGNLVELWSQGWRIEDPHRYIHLPPAKLGKESRNYLDQNFDTMAVVPLYEVMFDKPVVVEDSFVVAGTRLNNEGSFAWEVEPGTQNRKRMWLWDRNPTRYISLEGASDHLDLRRKVWYKFRTQNWKVGKCYSTNLEGKWSFILPMIFPIIELGFDTVMCHDARNIRVGERTDSSATLMWDSGDGGPWEVAFGKITDRWEDFTVTPTENPMLTMTGLEVGTVYFALVRSYCSVTQEYGGWSDPVEVEIYQQHNPDRNGMEESEEGDRLVMLMPNPASGLVSVVSSYRLKCIEVYDAKGEKVYAQSVDGITAEFDVSDWAKGFYVVSMRLERGVVTKKLLVR